MMKRILIVEDEGIVAADIKRCLEDAGFEVTGVAASAEDAFEEAAAECPDLVLMDVRIQGELDGVEAAELIHHRFGPPVVYLTAHGDKETIERAKKTLPLGFILKPFKETELINAIEFALEKAGAERVERLRDQAALQESEDRFRNLVGALPAGVYTCDAAGAITFFNERAAELWGRRPKLGDQEQRFRGALKMYRPDGSPFRDAETPMATAISGNIPLRGQEVIFERADGSRMHVLVNVEPMRDAAGTVTGAINTVVDITPLKEAQAQLLLANARLTFLSETAAGLLAADDPAKYLRRLWERLQELLGIDYAFYFAEQGGEFRLAAHHGIPQDAASGLSGLASSVSICHNAAAERRPVVVERAQERSDQMTSAIRQLGITAYACFPLLARERFIGALAFGSSLRQSFTEDEIALLNSVAGEVAIALDRKTAEDALRESEQRYRLIVEANPMGVMSTDVAGNRPGRILTANDAFLRMVGHSREDLESGRLHSADLTAPEYIPQDVKSVSEAREHGHSAPYEKEFVRKDGSRVPAMVARAAVREQQDKLVVFVADLTEHKRTEQALREAQKLESIGLLAGGIAHDFNNLLTSILGNASLLEMDAAAPEGPQQLKAIIESSEKAASLTRQLLAYAGKGQFQIADFDISRLVRSSADLLRVSIPKNIELRLDVPQALPAVMGDCSQIQQVVMNLIINAAEAIENRNDGEVSIAARLRDLDAVSSARIAPALAPGRYVCIDVKDNGCGMDERTRAQIFDPFFTTKFTGRGLGLAAVQGILRSHKGAITIESARGQGSTFTVYLPCSASAAAGNSKVATPVRRRDTATVLVVDDEEEVRAFTQAALGRLGHTVLLAENGRQALDLLDRGETVDLVLLDIIMPVLGGADAFSEIRGRWPNLPILVATGYSLEEVKRLGIPGDVPFIEKPYTVQRLAAAVGKAIEAGLTAGLRGQNALAANPDGLRLSGGYTG